MNRKQLFDFIRSSGAFPGTGQVQTNRLISLLHMAQRQLWADLPDALLRNEHRVRLEPPISVSTVSIDPLDRLVFHLDATPPPPDIPTDGTARGRWLRVTRGGVHFYRRIQDVYVVNDPFGAPADLYIVVDVPWDNSIDSGLQYSIYTYQYPYPADIKQLDSVYYEPDRARAEELRPMFKEDLDRLRWAEGWLEEGRVTRYARGDFFQLPAPHFKPLISTVAQPNNFQKWGFSPATGLEHDAALPPHYGPAGTFSYCYVHVWGRWPYDAWTRGDRVGGGGPFQRGALLPFYMSSPSEVSEQVTTTWGGSRVVLNSPDLDYDRGYGSDSTLKSYHHHGWEKWWFRARHATQDPTAAGNNALVKSVEADGIYYLWKITAGFETVTFDHGDTDPVDRGFQLRDFHGHTHLMFDRLPASPDNHVLAQARRRPQPLMHDYDSPNLPEECHMALANLVGAYLLGRRDGELDSESFFYKAYLAELDRLRREQATPGHDNVSFGDGLHVDHSGLRILDHGPVEEAP